jgi:hypothetical protein
MNPGKVDKRIPYYVLPGCEYMLDAGNACDADSMEIPGGCCPIGFECQQKGNGKVSSASGGGGERVAVVSYCSVSLRHCATARPGPARLAWLIVVRTSQITFNPD